MSQTRTGLTICVAFLGVAAGLLASCGNSGSGVKVEVPQIDFSQLSPNEQAVECAKKGDIRTLESLLQSDPKLVNTRGPMLRATLLHIAASKGDSKMVKFLLEHGANPRLQDEEGFTAADRAFQEGHSSIGKMIQEAAASAPATGGGSE